MYNLRFNIKEPERLAKFKKGDSTRFSFVEKMWIAQFLTPLDTSLDKNKLRLEFKIKFGTRPHWFSHFLETHVPHLVNLRKYHREVISEYGPPRLWVGKDGCYQTIPSQDLSIVEVLWMLNQTVTSEQKSADICRKYGLCRTFVQKRLGSHGELLNYITPIALKNVRNAWAPSPRQAFFCPRRIVPKLACFRRYRQRIRQSRDRGTRSGAVIGREYLPKKNCVTPVRHRGTCFGTGIGRESLPKKICLTPVSDDSFESESNDDGSETDIFDAIFPTDSPLYLEGYDEDDSTDFGEESEFEFKSSDGWDYGNPSTVTSVDTGNGERTDSPTETMELHPGHINLDEAFRVIIESDTLCLIRAFLFWRNKEQPDVKECHELIDHVTLFASSNKSLMDLLGRSLDQKPVLVLHPVKRETEVKAERYIKMLKQKPSNGGLILNVELKHLGSILAAYFNVHIVMHYRNNTEFVYNAPGEGAKSFIHLLEPTGKFGGYILLLPASSDECSITMQGTDSGASNDMPISTVQGKDVGSSIDWPISTVQSTESGASNDMPISTVQGTDVGASNDWPNSTVQGTDVGASNDWANSTVQGTDVDDFSSKTTVGLVDLVSEDDSSTEARNSAIHCKDMDASIVAKKKTKAAKKRAAKKRKMNAISSGTSCVDRGGDSIEESGVPTSSSCDNGGSGHGASIVFPFQKDCSSVEKANDLTSQNAKKRKFENTDGQDDNNVFDNVTDISASSPTSSLDLPLTNDGAYGIQSNDCVSSKVLKKSKLRAKGDPESYVNVTSKDLNEKLIVQESTIDGAKLGLFAGADIDPQYLVARYGGELVELKENEVPNQYMYNAGKFVLDATNETLELGGYINDAIALTKQNSHFKVDAKSKTVNIFSKRKIKAGEEIFASYGDEFWLDEVSGYANFKSLSMRHQQMVKTNATKKQQRALFAFINEQQL
jgi:hypothetical protein